MSRVLCAVELTIRVDRRLFSFCVVELVCDGRFVRGASCLCAVELTIGVVRRLFSFCVVGIVVCVVKPTIGVLRGAFWFCAVEAFCVVETLWEFAGEVLRFWPVGVTTEFLRSVSCFLRVGIAWQMAHCSPSRATR